MMMTAAGTVPAARIFVMGAGVAGLQAIATARRLGAVVTATDVRPAAKEQVESLGAKFVAVEDEEFKQAETAGRLRQGDVGGVPGQAGRSRRLPHRQAGHRHHHGPDPGPPGAEARHPGHGRIHEARLGHRRSGGRARRQLSNWLKPGEVVEHNGVKIVGHLNVPGRLAATASSLYAKNLYAFVETLVTRKPRNWP